MARKYQLKFAKGAPIDEHFLSFIDSMLSELNIPPATAQQMADKWQGYVGTRMAADAANTQRELDGLKTELLGSSYDGLAAGQRGARALGLKGSDLDRLQGSIGAAPVVRLMVALGKRFDGAAPAAGSGTAGAAGSADPLGSPEQARAEIEKLSRSKDWADKLFNPRAEGHAEAKARWDQLHAAAWPASEPSSEPSAAPAAPSGPTPDSQAAAKAKIDDLIGNASFMGSLSDKAHPEHQANRTTFDALHVEAGIRP